MTTTAEQMRHWRGPALFTYGFRPFFLGATLWAALAMVLWLLALGGWLATPGALDPVAWHAHELVFGYLLAVIAGFLTTAVPNWTGRMPIVGWPLAGLFGLWLLGRVVVALPAGLPWLAVALIDLSFGTVFAAAIAREIIAGKNWRNLVVLGLLGLLILGNALFHWEAMQGAAPAQGLGLRLGLGAGIMMIGLIGGRIVPSFTRNWLARRGPGALPVPPAQRFDLAALLALLAAVLLWIAAPDSAATAGVLILAGALHLVRLSRWCGHLTGAEPLLWILHLGYAFVPLGALALGLAILRPDLLAAGAALHLWLAGAVGAMTLAVMTRATLGHTGQPLSAGVGTQALYLLLLAAVLGRFLAGLVPVLAPPLHMVSALGWIGAMAGFSLLYGPALLRARTHA
ncbi:MAG: NnrS family protein [Pararhodobacter sp.]